MESTEQPALPALDLEETMEDRVDRAPGRAPLSGSGGTIWAVIILVLVAVLAWFLFVGRGDGDTAIDPAIPPAAAPSAPAPPPNP